MVILCLVGCDGGKSSGSYGKEITHNPVIVKFVANGEGFYQISLSQLIAQGFTQSDVDENSIKIYLDGTLQSFWIDMNRGTNLLRFFVPASYSRYFGNRTIIISNQNLNLLLPNDNDLANIEEEQDNFTVEHIKGDDMYIAKVLLEKNSIYQPMAESQNPWLWTRINSSNPTELTHVFDNVNSGTAKVKINLWSNSTGISKPGHRIILSLNDENIGEYSWNGIGFHTIEIIVDSGIIRNGKNVFSLSIPEEDTYASETVWLDWIEISYPRNFVPLNDQIQVTGVGTELKLMGFSGPVDIYQVKDENKIILITKQEPVGSKWVGDYGTKYRLVGPKGYKTPVFFENITKDVELIQDTNSADYLIISPKEFIPELLPLVEEREKQGLRSAIVPLSAIVNTFNNGDLEPETITRYISWVKENWANHPKYILIVGDFSYDPHGYISDFREETSFPSFFTRTSFGGETTSDIPFAIPESVEWINSEIQIDPIMMDVTIGRLPVQKKKQVREYISKVIAYEKVILSQENSGNILVVADNQEVSFRQNAEEFMSQVGDAWNRKIFVPEEIHTDELSVYDLVVYFGHGSIQQWGKSEIISVNDINQNNMPFTSAIIIQFTCLTGYFSHPMMGSLSDALLWSKVSGTVSTIAPTSLTLPVEQGVLSRALSKQLKAGNQKRIGDLYRDAWNQTAIESPQSMDLLMTFLLFGDPALLLPENKEP